MPVEPRSGLRERKKLDTRKALSDAALELMFERGLDNFVREDVAARAGVSLRTFSNYFASKDDALAYRLNYRIRYPRLVANVTIGAVNAVLNRYVQTGPEVAMSRVLREVFDGIAEGLPPPRT
jgi:AcrR family transcriptional regulator